MGRKRSGISCPIVQRIGDPWEEWTRIGGGPRAPVSHGDPPPRQVRPRTTVPIRQPDSRKQAMRAAHDIACEVCHAFTHASF